MKNSYNYEIVQQGNSQNYVVKRFGKVVFAPEKHHVKSPNRQCRDFIAKEDRITKSNHFPL